MITINSLQNRIKEFSSRKGKFSIGLPEFFSLMSDIVLKLSDIISGTAISMIYQPDVANIAALNAVPNPQKGWACRVLDQVDEKGNAYIYQYDGAKWNKTSFTAIPNNVATQEDIEKSEEKQDDKIAQIGRELKDIEREIENLTPSGAESLVSEERNQRIEADKEKLNYRVLESILETILNLLFPHQNGVNMDTILDLSLFLPGDTIRIFLPGDYEQFSISVPEKEFSSNFVFFRKNKDESWEKILIYKFNDFDFINN